MTSKQAGTEGAAFSADAEIHELLDRQIIEYRKAVGYFRLELSVEGGCVVSWQEAARAAARCGLVPSGHQAAA